MSSRVSYSVERMDLQFDKRQRLHLLGASLKGLVTGLWRCAVVCLGGNVVISSLLQMCCS